MNFWKSQRIFDEENEKKTSSNLSRRQRCLRCVHRVGDSAFYSQSTFLSRVCSSSLGRQSTCWQRWPLRAEGAMLKETERERARAREQVRACSEVLQRADKARQSGSGIKEAPAHTHTHTHFECVSCADDKSVAHFLGSISFAAHLGHTIRPHLAALACN